MRFDSQVGDVLFARGRSLNGGPAPLEQFDGLIGIVLQSNGAQALLKRLVPELSFRKMASCSYCNTLGLLPDGD